MQLGMVLMVLESGYLMYRTKPVPGSFQVPFLHCDITSTAVPSHHLQLHFSFCYHSGIEVPSLVTLVWRSAAEPGFKEEPDLSSNQAVCSVSWATGEIRENQKWACTQRGVYPLVN